MQTISYCIFSDTKGIRQKSIAKMVIFQNISMFFGKVDNIINVLTWCDAVVILYKLHRW